jgi:hypothetical protein
MNSINDEHQAYPGALRDMLMARQHLLFKPWVRAAVRTDIQRLAETKLPLSGTG